MAKYGFNNLKIEVDNSSGSLVDLSAYVMAINGVEVEQILEETTPAGVAWETWAPVGMGLCGAIELSGTYDNTATSGPNVILDALEATRTLQITWGGSKTTSCETIIAKYDRVVTKGALTRYTCTLQPTGTISEA